MSFAWVVSKLRDEKGHLGPNDAPEILWSIFLLLGLPGIFVAGFVALALREGRGKVSLAGRSKHALIGFGIALLSAVAAVLYIRYRFAKDLDLQFRLLKALCIFVIPPLTYVVCIGSRLKR